MKAYFLKKTGGFVMSYGKCGGGLFGGLNDWVWIIIAIIIISCLCGDSGLLGSSSNNPDCC